MHVSVERGEGLERRMNVGLEPEGIEEEVEQRLRDLARSARVPGFRPGKVPVKILRQRYGGQMRQDVFAERVQSSFSEAVAQEELMPAGMPHIELELDASAKRYAYTAVFEVLPTFELAPLEGKAIERPVAEVTEEDVDALLDRLREQRKTWEVVERAAQAGDQVRIAYAGTIDGEPFEGGSAEDVKVELGSGRMIAGFEDGLLGSSAGEDRRLDLQFPDNYPAEHLKGKAVAFDVRVREVSEPRLPELDADFAKGFGVSDGDLQRFRSEVRQNMERELKERVKAKVKAQVMDLLLEVNQIEVPEVLIKEEIGTLKQQMLQNVGGGGGGLELPDELFADQARRRVALGLVLGEVVKANEIKVDKDRVREAVTDMASTYENPQLLIDHYYTNKEHLASLESLTLEDQVVDWVLDQVSVQDVQKSFDDLAGPAAGA